MLDRLVGLETEYAIRFQPAKPRQRRPFNSSLFQSLVAYVRAKVPTAVAIHPANGWFLATGGCVKFEHIPFYLLPTSGFVEGSTPECRGPRQLLRYQRAQDVLFSEGAAAGGGGRGRATLLKNSHDGHGHYFGCHENYEATVASGARLWVWRLGVRIALAVLLPLLFVGLMLAMWFVLFSFPLMFVCYCLPGRARLLRGWAAAVTLVLSACMTPSQLFGMAFFDLTAFVDLRRQVLAFLISRTVVSGAGVVGRDGRFGLSPRALGVRSVCGVTSPPWRSVFYFQNVAKDAILGAGDPGLRASSRRPRQRLQVSIADSNMAQWAEYLKVGTTLLVLDAFEAGDLQDAPRLRRPIRALRAICADPDLRVSVELANGERRTALEIQRYYFEACRRFVNRCGPDHEEAHEILRLWGETLDALEEEPNRLVGKLDWVTKRYLLAQLGADAPVAARRKLDLRYHELAQDGYYLRLEAAGVAPTLVEPEQVRQAAHFPPEGTPATLRGQLIRQFADLKNPGRASWSTYFLPPGHFPSIVQLASPEQPKATGADANKTHDSG
jgi:proteasome accessory factor A